MGKKMEKFKQKVALSRNMERFKRKVSLSKQLSSPHRQGSLKDRFKRFMSKGHTTAEDASSTSSVSDIREEKLLFPSGRGANEEKSSSSSSSSDSEEGSPLKDLKSDSSSDSSSETKAKKSPSLKNSDYSSEKNPKSIPSSDNLDSGSDSSSGKKAEKTPSLKNNSDSSSDSSPEKKTNKSLSYMQETTSGSSSDSSSDKKRKNTSSKLRREKSHPLLRPEYEVVSKLPSLEETPPPSPQSNSRPSSASQSDATGRIKKYPSTPTSPADLAHNFNLYYRGGDSSPVALIHSLSQRESGKHASQLSEISFASPPRSSSPDYEVTGECLRGMSSARPKTAPLKLKRLPSAHRANEQGFEVSYADVGALDRSTVQEMLAKGDERPMTKPDRGNDFENVSSVSSGHHEDHSRSGEMKSSGSTGHHDVEDQSNACRTESEGSANHRVLEVQRKAEGVSHGSPDHDHDNVKDQSMLESLSNGSTEHHDKEDQNQSKFESLPSGSPDHHEVEDQSKLESVPNGSPACHKVEHQSSFSDERVPSESTDDHEVQHQSKMKILSNGLVDKSDIEDQSKLGNGSAGSTDHHGVEKQSRLEDSAETGVDVTGPTRGDTRTIPDIENVREKHLETEEANLEEVITEGDTPQVRGGEVEGHESNSIQRPEGLREKELDDVQLLDNKDEVGHGKRRIAAAHQWLEAEESNGNNPEHVDNAKRLKDVDGQSRESEMEEMQSRVNQDAAERQQSKQVEAVREGEEVEPRVTTDDDMLDKKAEIIRVDKAIKPRLSTANGQDGNNRVNSGVPATLDDTGHKNVAMEEDESRQTVEDKEEGEVSQAATLDQSNYLKTADTESCKVTGNDGKDKHGLEGPDCNGQHEMTGVKSAEGKLVEASTSQENLIRTEKEGKDVEGPNHKEQLEVKNEEGRLAEPSLSLQDHLWEQKNEENARLLEDGEITNEAHVQHESSRMSTAELVKYDFEQRLREQKTHDLICSECGSCVTKTVILRKKSRTPEVDRRSTKSMELRSGGSDLNGEPCCNDNESETWGCLPCLSFFLYTDKGARQTLERPEPGEEGQQSSERVSSEVNKQERERVHCFPIYFPWFRWGPANSEPDLLEPLLESDFEQVVHDQKTHDLMCPVCGICVTKTVVLRRRTPMI